MKQLSVDSVSDAVCKLSEMTIESHVSFHATMLFTSSTK